MKKEVNMLLEKINEKTGSHYDVRKQNTRPDLYKTNYKYFLYMANDGYVQLPGTYGTLIEGFKTQKEIANYLQSRIAEYK